MFWRGAARHDERRGSRLADPRDRRERRHAVRPEHRRAFASRRRGHGGGGRRARHARPRDRAARARVRHMSVVIRGAQLLSMVEHARPTAGDMVISGSRISAMGADPSVPMDAEVLDRPGHFVLPGLIQTHVHLVQTIFRGLAEDLTLLDWLRRRVWPLEAAHDDDTIRASVRLGLLEMLTSGTTTVLDMGTTKGGDAQAE